MKKRKKRKRIFEKKEQKIYVDTRRQAMIAYGQPWDHTSEVLCVNENVDLSQTIFKTVESNTTRKYLEYRFGLQPAWLEAAAQEVHKAFSCVPLPPKHNAELLNFMNEKCDFEVEHADGSFLDHLQFCYEYSYAHFPEHSPRVLFLHSIMGVGTNLFPMSVDEIPDLQALLSHEEYKHIEAFPSMLRLLTVDALLPELEKLGGNAKKITEIQFHRLLGNKEISLTGEEFWIQLNYQLIHWLDFLPFVNWKDLVVASPFPEFIRIHKLLTKLDKLFCRVDLDLSCSQTGADTGPLTVGKFMEKVVLNIGDKNRTSLVVKNVKNFSKKIGHSLDYTLTLENSV